MGYGSKPWYDLVYLDVGTRRNVKHTNMGREETRRLTAELAPRLKAGEIGRVKVTNRFGVDVTVDFFGDSA